MNVFNPSNVSGGNPWGAPEEEESGPIRNLLKINQNIGDTILKGGAQVLDKYDKAEQKHLPFRRPAIEKSSKWVDDNLTSLLKNVGVKESWAEKSGDIAGVTTNILGEVLTPGLEETIAANAQDPRVTAGSYTKGTVRRSISEVRKIPDYTRLISGIFDGRWTMKNGKKTLITPEGIEIDPNNLSIMQSTTKGGGSGPTFRHSILNKTNRGLYKQLKNQDPKLIDQAEDIIKELDLFKTSEGSSQQFTKWNPDRPTTGFRGTRTVPYINSDGVASEVAFRWSKSANNGTGGYKAYDLVRRQNTILKRLRWNVNRSPKAKWYADNVYKSAKGDNAVLRQLLKELREENPQRYFDIMGDTRNYAENKGFIFVEHIHSQNSPYWKYVSKGKFKPRDTSNLMIVKNENFGKLKTSIEKHIYDNKEFVFPDGKRLILDYDKTRDVLVLKQLQDNGRLNRIGDISPITNPRNWKRALDAALQGHTIRTGKIGEIQQVIQGDPDIDRNVDLRHGISDWNKPKE